jgi:PBP1b-binding outer membrane lipoprotein LpoB
MKKLLLLAVPFVLIGGCSSNEAQPANVDQGANSPQVKANPPSDLLKQKIRDSKIKKKGD